MDASRVARFDAAVIELHKAAGDIIENGDPREMIALCDRLEQRPAALRVIMDGLEAKLGATQRWGPSRRA
jgi:hypothetical protein